MTLSEQSALSIRLEELLKKLSVSSFNQTRDTLVSDPYSVLSKALDYMVALNLLKEDDEFSKQFFSKVETFKGLKLEDLEVDFVEEFIRELNNVI